MIYVTGLNRSKFWLSSDQIESIESTPDTVVTLLSGKKFVIRESATEIIDAIVAFRRRVLAVPEILVDKPGKETCDGSRDGH